MTSKERIIQFIEYKQISNRKFCIEISVSHTYFSKKGAMGTDVLEKIYTIHPDLNIDWVITGRDEMIYKPQTITMKNKQAFGNFLKSILKIHELTIPQFKEICKSEISPKRIDEILKYTTDVDYTPLQILDAKFNTNYFFEYTTTTKEAFDILTKDGESLPVITTTFDTTKKNKNHLELLKNAAMHKQNLEKK